MKRVLQPLWIYLTEAFHRVAQVRSLGPLSVRCLLLVALGLYLLVSPVARHTDIVSAALAYGLLGTILTLAVTVAAQGLFLRRHLAVAVVPPSDEGISGEAVRVAITVPRLRLLPLLSLDLRLESSAADFPKAALRVTGFSSGDRSFTLDLTLPHRGAWPLTALRCEVKDAAGLACVSWLQPLASSIEVGPPEAGETRLPLISSTQRPGDLAVDVFNRQGDPFDIKAYHPSDGIKKIVWKAYAKSGELLSRHPEASMTPEGYVVMMVLARPEDDVVCSSALAYAQAVSELKLDVVAGCEGLGGRAPATSPALMRELLIDAVWDARRQAGEALQEDTVSLLDFCANQALRVQVKKLLIFCAGSRVAEPAESARILKLAGWLTLQGIEPAFCVTAPERLLSAAPRGAIGRIAPLVFEPDPAEPQGVSASQYRSFLAQCLSKQWEVFV